MPFGSAAGEGIALTCSHALRQASLPHHANESLYSSSWCSLSQPVLGPCKYSAGNTAKDIFALLICACLLFSCGHTHEI